MHSLRKLLLSTSLLSMALLLVFYQSPYAAQLAPHKADESKMPSSVIIWKGDTKVPDSRREQQITKALHTHRQSLLQSDSPFTGAQKSQVTLVVFLDYQCSHCKKMAPLLENLQHKNPNLKIIYKDLPILGAHSTQAAKAALAAQKQGKYSQMADQLMQTQKLSSDSILEMAQSAGLNLTQFKQDLASNDLQDQLQKNINLAHDFTIKTTPLILIINEHQDHSMTSKPTFFVTGDVTLETLENLVRQAKD